LTIKSLKLQTMRPDRIVLWLYEPDAEKLPRSVLGLIDDIFQINTVDRNLRSFTKLIPSLQEFPEAHVVTADDDVYYPPHWLEKIVHCYDTTRAGPVGWRGHLIRTDASGLPAKYAKWQHNVPAAMKSQRLMLTGVGGILYPPGVFPPEVMNADTFLHLCPTADDLWFYFMLRRNNQVCRTIGKPSRIYNWRGSQSNKLWSQNARGGNDDALRNLIEEFGMPFEPI